MNNDYENTTNASSEASLPENNHLEPEANMTESKENRTDLEELLYTLGNIREQRRKLIYGGVIPASKSEINQLWGSALSSSGTLAEIYLESCDFYEKNLLDAFRFLPAYPHAATGTEWPIMLKPLNNVTGELQALSITYLNRDGVGGAPVEPNDIVKGDDTGCSIHVRNNAGEHLEVICGLEAASSIMCRMEDDFPPYLWVVPTYEYLQSLILPAFVSEITITELVDQAEKELVLLEKFERRMKAAGRKFTYDVIFSGC